VWYCTGMCMLCGKWSGVVLDIERQNAMPTLGIPRNSHLRGGMRGVSYFSFLGGPPRSNFFLRNESAGGMSGSRKGLSEKKTAARLFWRSTVLCVAGFHLQR
jgi:hypothetical protein